MATDTTQQYQPLIPYPRCPIICRHPDTGRVVRCARWDGHTPEDDHRTYRDVIEDMADYLVAQAGLDTKVDKLSLSERIIFLRRARAWYDKMVL